MTCPSPALFGINRLVHLASTVLPAAGLFTQQGFFDLPPGSKELNYWITYTRGAAGGYPVGQVQWGNGVEESSELILDETSFVAAPPFGEFNVYIEQPLFPAPASASALSYILETIIPYGATKARLLVAERGVPATPGTIVIAYTGGVGQP